MTVNEEELKSLLMKVKVEWKSWLKAQHAENEDHGIWSHHFMASLVAQMVKRLPAMRETRIQFLGQGDPLEKEMAIHSSTLAWKIHGQRSLIGYSPWGLKE